MRPLFGCFGNAVSVSSPLSDMMFATPGGTCRRGQHTTGNYELRAKTHEAVLNCEAECEFCYENVWCIHRLCYVEQVTHASPCFVCTYAHTKDVQQCECKTGSSKTCCQHVALKSLHSQDNKPEVWQLFACRNPKW